VRCKKKKKTQTLIEILVRIGEKYQYNKQESLLTCWKNSSNHKMRKYSIVAITFNQNTRLAIDCMQQAIAEVS
jgi:hypothetical protein